MIRFSGLLRFTSDCEMSGREETTMRKSIFYQPLAVLMAILVAAPLSWLSQFGNGSHRAGAGPFQAAAQSGSPGGSITTTGIDLGEGDALRAYLALHTLPETDSNLIYSTGRGDLRTDVRAIMETNLLAIIR